MRQPGEKINFLGIEQNRLPATVDKDIAGMQIPMIHPFGMQYGQIVRQSEHMARIAAIDPCAADILGDKEKTAARIPSLITEKYAFGGGNGFFFQPVQVAPFGSNAPRKHQKTAPVLFVGERTDFQKKFSDRGVKKIDLPAKALRYKRGPTRLAEQMLNRQILVRRVFDNTAAFQPIM